MAEWWEKLSRLDKWIVRALLCSLALLFLSVAYNYPRKGRYFLTREPADPSSAEGVFDTYTGDQTVFPLRGPEWVWTRLPRNRGRHPK